MSSSNRVATNQPPPLVDYDVFASDRALVEAVRRYGRAETVDDLSEIGRLAGTAEAQEHGRLANRHVPTLRTFDRYGNRVDEVEFHPSWHWLMERGVGFGLQGAPWDGAAPDAHVRRAAGFFAWSQVEPGHGCPISMTYAAVPALRADETIAKEWVPRLTAATYDFGLRAPPAMSTLVQTLDLVHTTLQANGLSGVERAASQVAPLSSSSSRSPSGPMKRVRGATRPTSFICRMMTCAPVSMTPPM